MKTKKYFYAFRLWGNRNTTRGLPNPRTGRMNRAGSTHIFTNKIDRRIWSNDEPANMVIFCNKKGLRDLLAGFTTREFEDYLKIGQSHADMKEEER